MRLRYGLYGGKPLGVRVVARQLGIPWPKVKELEAGTRPAGDVENSTRCERPPERYERRSSPVTDVFEERDETPTIEVRVFRHGELVHQELCESEEQASLVVDDGRNWTGSNAKSTTCRSTTDRATSSSLR